MGKNSFNCLARLPRPSAQYPRQFVPNDIDLEKWEHIEPLIGNLIDRHIRSREDLTQWLDDESELSGVISEERSRRYAALTCATDNKEIEKAYLYFIENIIPKVQPLWHKIDQKFLDSPYLYKLNQKRYEILVRRRRNSKDLFKEVNIPLNVEIAKLGQQYQKIMGGKTVEFEGKEHTIQRMWVYLQDQDRNRRKKAWELLIERELKDSEKLDELFNKMLKLRVQIAKNAGFDDFRTYQFRLNNRFDYTPDDCFFFHESIERYVVPLAAQLQEERRQRLGYDTIRPWDKSCDRYGRGPLKPFKSIDDLTNGCREIFGMVDTELGDYFQRMMDLELLDLESRKGKAPGGYQLALGELRLPFIFMNAVGLNSDVFTLLHEGGHAFNLMAVSDDPLIGYRSSPKEFSEVASLSMELLGSAHLNVFYNDGDAARARRNLFEDMTWKLNSVAINDAFQHWIYTHPDHTSQERADFYMQLLERFSSGVDWSGYEKLQATAWHTTGHIFRAPFYFIEYGIAQLGALQVWLNSKNDKKAAIEAYKAGLRLGGSRPLPELFRAANTEFDFSDRVIEPMMAEVAEEIERQSELESK
ncbi:M3 family oligoendopeptidase [bacterium]|nr:M3 family oligoendopeptidase [bacterium]